MKRVMIFVASACLFAAVGVIFGPAEVEATAWAPRPRPAAMGFATIKWVAPMYMADGKTPAALSGFRVYSGRASGQYTAATDVADPLATSVTLPVAPGLTYFAVAAVGVDGSAGAPGYEVSAVIEAIPNH